jgi:hypothetical protein
MKNKKQIARETNGEVYTRKEFMKLVDAGAFIPYDGIGYFHDGTNRTDISVWNNSLTAKDVEKYPYVCWYNR